tara:strand:+ start:107 stop:286 length:180 start_codon:yes stop_codon:yes gene_type:complete
MPLKIKKTNFIKKYENTTKYIKSNFIGERKLKKCPKEFAIKGYMGLVTLVGISLNISGK